MLDTKKVVQIGIVVKDLDKVLKNYAQLFGIEVPDVQDIPSTQDVPTIYKGKRADFSDCKLAVIQLENTVIELTQPGKSDSPWKAFLDEHGPGVFQLGFQVSDGDAAYRDLGALGISKEHEGFYSGLTYTFTSQKESFEQLGVDLNVKWETDNSKLIASLVEDQK